MYYQSLLIVHLLAVVFAFFAAGAITVLRSLLVKAETPAGALAVLKTSGSIAMLMPVFSVILLVSGLLLTKAAWSFTNAWVVLAIVGLVAMSVIGGAVLKPRGMALAKTVATLPQLTADTRRALADPAGQMAELTNIALSTAIVLLMILKPSLTASLGIFVGVPALILAGAMIVNRRRSAQLTPAVAPEA